MTDYCLFTIEHSKASRVYVRGVADITEPIDDYDKIVWFRNGSELQHKIPSNPYKKGDNDFKLYEELVNCIKDNFEAICDELVFAKTNEIATEWENRYSHQNILVEFEKVIV